MNPKIIISREEFIKTDLWKLFPCINIDRTRQIPCDYPGAMGVPITALDKIVRNDGKSGLLILGILRPTINGKLLYQRLIIRNLNPVLPDRFELNECLEYFGLEYVVSCEQMSNISAGH